MQTKTELMPNHYSDLYEKYLVLLTKNYENDLNMVEYINRINLEK